MFGNLLIKIENWVSWVERYIKLELIPISLIMWLRREDASIRP